MIFFSRKSRTRSLASIILNHFSTRESHRLVTASRSFPVTARIDLQAVLLDLVSERCAVAHLSGVQSPYSHQTLTLGTLAVEQEYGALPAPLGYEEVDVGEFAPVRCMKDALWLGRIEERAVAILIAPTTVHGSVSGWQVEMASVPQDGLPDPSVEFLAELERRLAAAGSYRGKVISLEQRDNYSGQASSVRVHKLPPVSRDEVILPEVTILQLERNVSEFVDSRERLRELGMATKKGLLFHGPPGTGKTHTIRYLASCLPDHTTLLIAAEQVALLDEYIQLARFLQPAMVVLEDVDLIARSRTSMRNPCEESLLNKLLNEMDGLREDADLLFVLTTNRPQDLEAALAARPGRVDQAIEFPLPLPEGRRKLTRLYAGRLQVSDEVVERIVQKTEGASAAFIKELMRRSAQTMLRHGDNEVALEHAEASLDEMLFAGGSLNLKLLGGAASEQGTSPSGT